MDTRGFFPLRRGAFNVRMNPLLTITVLSLTVISALTQECKPINFGSDSIVCECSATHCDYYPDPGLPNVGDYIWYVSSKDGERLKRTNGQISKEMKNKITIKINPNVTYQTMEGFGGSFTDAAGINIKKLSQGAQDNLMRSYFGPEGSKYNFGRVPIAGSDFSTRAYTYDDSPGDTELKNFTLASEDYDYKIPLMKQALELNPSLRFVSASWTAPPWMKSNNRYNGFGYLLDNYYQVYADYIVKFLEEYKKNGLEIWAVSTGNEPFTSLVPLSHINKMYMSPSTAGKWVEVNLGPTLQKSSSSNTLILALDDQRIYLPWYMIDMRRSSPAALKYISGIAVHWYTDEVITPGVLDVTHNQFPDKFILLTEFSIGDRPWEYPKVLLGSWTRADRSARKIFENINHWVVGWIDWNLALDRQGGPNWVENYVDALIIVDEAKDVFYKQPMYYVLTHFSKFVPRTSVRISTECIDRSILSTAFKTNNGEIVVLLYNTNNGQRNVTIVDEQVGNINLELPAYSIHTVLYRN